MGNQLNHEELRADVKLLTSGVNSYFAENYNQWEKETRGWVALKAEELLPAGDREHLVDEIDKNTPRLLLEQLSDEWQVEDGKVDSLVTDIKAKVEGLRETLGAEVTSAIVAETIKWLKAKAAQLVHVEFEWSIETLNWLYENAKEVTIMEFLTRSNFKDVIEYHEELRKKLWEMHYEAIEWHEAKILTEVARAMENIAVSLIPQPQTTHIETYYCRECGAPFHRGDVFCSNPACGKLITYMDYDD